MELDDRGVFAERFALLYAAAGDPPLKRIAESVVRARRTDEQGRPIRVSVQRLSDWRRGRNVPARFSALAVALEILIGEARKANPVAVSGDLYNVKAWHALWERALNSPVAGEVPEMPAADSGVCPYRGLASFGHEDSSWFFGRERATSALLKRLDKALDTGGITMLVGASGSGKSSLLRAGVLPALANGGLAAIGPESWSRVIMTPGTDPLGELLNRLPELAAPLAAAANDEIEAAEFARQVRAAITPKLVLVVDQFEETFTLCRDEHERRVFVAALHAACTGDDAPALVALGVRADFYGHCLDFPELAEALQERQMVLGAMTAAELRDAITRPAKAVGLQFEPGLVDLIVRDLGVSSKSEHTTGGAYDAGALPLLSHALLATWQRRQAGKLTIAGFRAAGGIQGAVAATAERAWAELPPAGQNATHDVLLGLVHVGRNTRDTRRRSTRAEIVGRSGDHAAAEEAIETLARARLVTLDADSVEITHEALLQAWPRLRSWIDRDRAGNLARQRLEEDAEAWDAENRDPSLLYRGARLEGALYRTQSGRPSSTAQDFLDASTRFRRRSIWTRRVAVALVCVLAVVAGIAAVLAINERDDAEFRQVLAQADRLQDSNPSLSAQLGLVAHELRPTDADVYSRVLMSQNMPLAMPILGGHTGSVYETTFSADGKMLATAGFDNTVRLWDVQDRGHPKPLGEPIRAHTSWVTSAVFSPDSKRLATAGDDKTIRVWDITDPAKPVALAAIPGEGGTIYSMSFSMDGTTLATANEDTFPRLWQVSDPAHPRLLAKLTGHSGPVRSVEFASDGRTLGTAGDDKTVRLWDVSTLATPIPLGQPLTGNADSVHSVTFSPDSKLVATAGEDKTVRLWSIADREHPQPLGQPITTHSSPVWEVAFSPDGQMLASAGMDSTARLWNLTDPTNPQQVGLALASSNSGTYTVAFGPDSHTVVTGSADGSTSLWSLPPTVLIGHSYYVSALEFSRNGHVLATAGGDKTARLWDVSDPAHPTAGAALTGHTTYVNDLALSDDGQMLITTSGDHTVRIWDVRDIHSPKLIGAPLVLETRYGGIVALTPDKKVLAVKDGNASVTFFDLTNPTHPTPLTTLSTGDPDTSSLNDFEFSPSGELFATIGTDKTLRLFNVRDHTHPTPIGPGIPQPGRSGTLVAFSPDNKTLATTSDTDNSIILWNITDPATPTMLGHPITGHTESISSVSFSQDGHTLASTGKDKTVRLWNITNPDHPTQTTELTSSQTGYAVAFDPTNNYLASTTADALVRLWDLDMTHAITRICSSTTNVLTEDQWSRHLSQLTYAPPCK
ncbi:AAA family ATPase [Actinocrispum sp. NPDC049592]|uniref:nSTAND1 domain-containing NTPase n=1 Tax=Actinocrispum sp. NPDC049592 TaxID=3154835 RepID=UPI00342C0342